MKWRWFRNLLGGADPDSERIYRWHLEKRAQLNRELGIGMDENKARSSDHYLFASRRLHCSMAMSGFLRQHPIPIDPDGELLGGAHRLACALALGIKEVYVSDHARRAWAPDWGYGWFVTAGMSPEDLLRLDEDWKALTNG